MGPGWPVVASTRSICKIFCRNQYLAQAATAGREALRLAKATLFRIPSSARKGSIDSYRKKPLDSGPSYSPMEPSFNPSPSRGPRIRLVYQVAGDRAGQANAWDFARCSMLIGCFAPEACSMLLCCPQCFYS